MKAKAGARRHGPRRAAPDLVLRASPRTVSWGWIRSDLPPVLRVRPGQRVRIETVSHQGLNTALDPAAYFARAGIPAREVLPEAREIHRTLQRPEGAGPHLVTGPLYIEGARPGDLLEVRVLEIALRVGYGVNATGPGYGVLPDLLAEPASRIVRLDRARRLARFAPGLSVPLAPFMGILAVAPDPALGPASTKPPGPFGGNLDLRHLTAGSRLYLPVFNEGALFYAGDGHAAQGDGEVDGTAIETSLAPMLQFFVHPQAGRALRWPRAEDARHHYVLGMGPDLDVALAEAVRETVAFLGERAGLAPAEAYALASLAVDFRIGEAVNAVKMAYGAVPKRLLAPRGRRSVRR
jgi:acetamidase/formamidase